MFLRLSLGYVECSCICTLSLSCRYEKNNLKAQLFFAKNSPHPLICVAVCSFMNFGPTPVDNLNFQAAVPKQIEVKLLPPTGTTLPTPNPMLGQQAVTQLMLIRNPTKVGLHLK